MKYLCVDLFAHNSGQFHVEKNIIDTGFLYCETKAGRQVEKRPHKLN
mgnify:CR=1 FL=1